MKVDIQIINAFAVDGKGGNPAGVVFDADGLSRDQKQYIAQKVALPETAFVSRSAIADIKLDFFTPIKQIAHCGHATIATFTYLKKNGMIKGDHSSKETIDGRREIVFKGGYAYMEQTAPRYLDLPKEETAAVYTSVGLQAADSTKDLKPTIVHTGNGYLIVPVGDEDALRRIVPQQDTISAISAKYGLIGYYVYTPVSGESFQATTRMFAPFYGIPEEAGTGMAAGPLACFLHDKGGEKSESLVIEQGKFMAGPSRSLLYAELVVENHVIQQLYVGGDAYVSSTFTLEI